MSDYTISFEQHPPTGEWAPRIRTAFKRNPAMDYSASLAKSITREASFQTYFTIRYLVDRPLVADAFRAYAYFRWVDDQIDQGQASKTECLAFLARQLDTIGRSTEGKPPADLYPEETMVVDLIQNHPGVTGGLRVYIEQMMKVMSFDAERKGRYIDRGELVEYTRALATAVTEALHFFIGHSESSPRGSGRYLAVTGAHITHMLRDAVDDAADGYYNIPCEYLLEHGLSPTGVDGKAYKSWVRDRVRLARECFAAGRVYMAAVQNSRCRLAGYAYIARFEVVLEAIEKDGYLLRSAYPERKSIGNRLKMVLAALAGAFGPRGTKQEVPVSNPITASELL